MARKHARIIQHPFTISLQGALLDSYQEQLRGNDLQITLGVRSFERSNSELVERSGLIYECVQGSYVPEEIHFAGVSELKGGGVFTSITHLAPNDPTRMINDMLCWQPPERQELFYLFFIQETDPLMFFARRVTYAKLSQAETPITLERDWCPPPPMPGRLIPKPRRLHGRFGGDPISLSIGGRTYHHRLFVGGLDIQPTARPQVDVVFNLGERSSNWARDNKIDPPDRWDNKGEGPDGMSLDIIREEANWVIEHLKANKRVLVHCAAGMNRSVTICCAVLILLEGLTAEQALERVRQHHPWARPDSGHWLKLRWLAKTNC